MNVVGLVETLWQDLRYGARVLRLNPGFALVAILSLALGIGANTAIFQLLDALRLRALPVAHPQELAEIRLADGSDVRGSQNSWNLGLTNPLWEKVQREQQVFSGIFAWSDISDFNLAPSGEARNAHGLWVSGDFFRVLGVPPLLGRVFSAADDHRGCGLPGAVISYGFWQSEFAGDPSVIGKQLTLEHYPVEIIGVTPAGFSGLEVGRSFDVAVPICSFATLGGAYNILDDGVIWWLTVMGRLKPGVSLSQASAELAAISPGIFQDTLPKNYPAVSVKDYLAFRLVASPASTGLSPWREQYGSPLALLLAATALILLIACANLASLMLARASAREREIAVRQALGGSRGRLVRQLLAESLLLAAVGAGLGLLLASGLSQFLVSFLSTSGNSLFVNLQLDWRVLSFTAGLAVLTCVLFGLAPAFRATRVAPGAVMKAGSRGVTASRERFGLRRALVASQIALSLVLLVGALLFSRSLHNLVTVDPGFEQKPILVAYLDLTALKLAQEPREAFKRDLLERLRAVPGVDSVAQVAAVPLGGARSDDRTWLDGEDISRSVDTDFNFVSGNYFKTMGTRLLAGRDFDGRDTRTSVKVAIVNEELVRRLGLGPDPVGRRFHREATPSEAEMVFEIVGVVRNTKYWSLREDFPPIAFLPASQDPRYSTFMPVVFRASAPLAAVTAGIKQVIAGAGPETSIEFHVFQDMIRDGLVRERLMATLSGFFGLLAALLATIGLYGVMSYLVVRRTSEIGIRMALGADPRAISRMILAEAGTLLAVGVVAGGVLALIAARAASAMLFGLQPGDPLTFAAAVAALTAVAAAASYLPARRAARLDPMVALREE